tara:strand:- start:206 stop:388 length:183 start_codon:yes stop_codon:yes gene_type:complete
VKYLNKAELDEKEFKNKYTTNVVNLIKKVKIEEKKRKKQNVIIAAAAISALILSGIIITH